MLQQDTGLQRVDQDWVAPYPPPISIERLNEYRKLLRNVDCERGLEWFDQSRGITFIASAHGLVTGGSSKNYYYTSTTLTPLTSSLDTYKPSGPGDG